MTEFEIRRPDDWHVHLRDGAALKNTVADMSRYFGRAIIMPNLTPPVRSVKEAGEYRQRILDAGAVDDNLVARLEVDQEWHGPVLSLVDLR